MSVVAGIDLGTTNCCVAVPADADIPDKQALIEGRRLRPVGGALIVANPDLSVTTPSAVWIAPDGTPQVGALAKRRARRAGSPPAMFFKRNMGTDQPVTAGHATLTPLQASVHLLRHLKTAAEETLGVGIDRAVITVPAYFETSAKTQTTRAGAEAGLDVAETLMEPVAAALAHLRDRQDGRARRFLVYDLGGGTFDTSVVSWDPVEGFTSRSFDGNRYLGGYDFDQAIVDWIIAQLPAYDLRLSPEDPRDAELLARLLALAETAKHELTRETETDIVDHDLDDRAGTPMSIDLPLARAQFEQMIEGSLRGTLDQCAEALTKARLTAADLDEIVLVGGSSRVPLVSTMLERRFGLVPRTGNPDLVVAVGAALKAASLATRGSLLELEEPLPDGGVVDIAGRVLAPIGEQEIVVVVRGPDGTEMREVVTKADGSFLFLEVPLAQDGEDDEFTLTVLIDGREAGTESLTLESDSGVDVHGLAGDILAHDFSVELLDRQLCQVVPSGTRIPHRVYQRLETATRGSSLAVRLYEGWIPIGAVHIRDLPDDLAPGTGVELTLEFGANWTIDASVRLPHLDRVATAVIDIPIRAVASWNDLGTGTATAHSLWRQARADAHHSEVERARSEIEQRLSDLDALLARRQDRAKAHHLLLETETILQGLLQSRGPEDYLEPPRAEYEENLRALGELLLLIERDDPTEALPFRIRTDDLRVQAEAAYEAGDFTTWPRVNEKITDLIREIERIPAIREILVMQATPRAWRAWLTGDIAKLDAEIRRRFQELSHDSRIEPADRAELPGRRDDLFADLAAIGLLVDQVPLDRPSAREQFRNIYFDRVKPLEARISRWGRQAGMRRSQ